MNPARICLLIFCLTSSMALSAIAQDKDKPGNKPESTSSTTDAEQPKSEVQLMLDEAKKRGEPIMGTCLEKCGDDSSGKSAEGVETGHALELPQPAYPPLAARAHVSGEVRVQVIVDLDGKVIAASAISGHPLLQPAAVKAARGAVFTPMKFEGKPVRIVGVISYNFVRS
jgi:TonB family protein